MRPAHPRHNLTTYTRPLIASALIAGGLLQLAAPIYAAGTAAGEDISNTATATYEDPTGAVSNTTSNTVVVKVSEVAGITITAGAVKNTGATAVTTGAATDNGSTPAANNNLVFEFDLTNIGNDTTDFRVPNQAQVGSSPVTVSKVQYQKPDGTWEDVNTVNNVIKIASAGGDIIPGAVVKVRVLATVNAGTTSGAINVTLGNTGQTNLQNDPFSATGGDVYTVDKADGTTSDAESDGVPSNGVREAAATATTVVNPGKQAFVKVTKVAGTVDPGTTPNDITDDKVTYELGLNVADTAPAGTNLVAEDLAGTAINLNGVVVPRILVSDAIPAGAKLAEAPEAPTNWTVVYTETPLGTTAANDSSVEWKTFVVGTTEFNKVTRVGYVFTGAAGKIAKGTSVPGFKLKLSLNLPATGGSKLNIAQAFGTTLVNDAPDPTKPAVDESGDAQFNNLNSDGTTGPTPTNGIATGADGVDSNTSPSTGTGPGGEATIVTINPPAPPANTIGVFNGPENKPTATGPSGGANDDFTNKSVTIDTTQAKWSNGVPGTVNPQSMGFTNSVAQGAGATRPQFVSLLPTTPANKADLPTGTIVKIISGGVAVSYTYDSGTGVFTPANGAKPITLTVPTTGNVEYGVEIDLPDGTAQLQGFPVPITSFANGAPAVVNPSTGIETFPAVGGDDDIDVDDAQNVTINRLYTGYLRLAKEAQVYKTVNGVTTIVSPFSPNAAKAAPGEYIEYRIKYSNISEPVPTGSNSVGLSANNIKITENGAIPGGNNWAANTEHKPQSAQDNQGSIQYDGGAKTNGDLVIDEYINTVPTLAPGAVGQFTFTRQVK